MLDGDLYCVQCGYNLRGLAADGKCPECGTRVARAVARAAASDRSLRFVLDACRSSSLAAVVMATAVIVSLLVFVASLSRPFDALAAAAAFCGISYPLAGVLRLSGFLALWNAIVAGEDNDAAFDRGYIAWNLAAYASIPVTLLLQFSVIQFPPVLLFLTALGMGMGYRKRYQLFAAVAQRIGNRPLVTACRRLARLAIAAIIVAGLLLWVFFAGSLFVNVWSIGPPVLVLVAVLVAIWCYAALVDFRLARAIGRALPEDDMSR